MRHQGRSKALILAWFDFQPEAVRGLAERLQHIVRAAEPELVETIKWGNLVFMLDGAAVLAIAPHKAHVNLQLFNGSELPPGLGLLEGAGRGTRSLRCRLQQPVDPVQVEMLVAACVSLAHRQAALRPPRQSQSGEQDAPVES
jgi:hypothetical protein